MHKLPNLGHSAMPHSGENTHVKIGQIFSNCYATKLHQVNSKLVSSKFARPKSSKIIDVRLNLFNHVLALFHAKFACNLAIRYAIVRWELCKGSV